MADTFGELVTEIVDESRRSMSSQIATCILDAIAHYEPERFWFNESTNTFSLSSSQAVYTSADASFIPRIMQIDNFKIRVGSNDIPVLRKHHWTEFDQYNSPDVFSQPTAWGYWGQSIRVDPAADGGYLATVTGVLQLPSLSLSTDTNAWTQRGNGKELIKRRAMALLYATYLRDDANALRCTALEQQTFERLMQRSERLHATNEITPCL